MNEEPIQPNVNDEPLFEMRADGLYFIGRISPKHLALIANESPKYYEIALKFLTDYQKIHGQWPRFDEFGAYMKSLQLN